jgi:quercetin dioxygenase-like cupin family protein
MAIEEMGGDPPCWAHLFEDEECEPRANQRGHGGVVDLKSASGATGERGPVWTKASDDLNVNLIVLSRGEGVAEHVNAEVDVLFVGVDGEGMLTTGDDAHRLLAGQVLLVPKGAHRSIRATSERLAYLTCHRRRGGLRSARRR